MMYFFVRFISSLSTVKYYQLVLIEKFSSTLKFYLMFLFLIAVLLAGKFWLHDLPVLKTETSKLRETLITNYPQDLVLNWDGTELNSSHTVNLPFPSNAPISLKEMADNVGFIDTDEELDSYSSLLAITPTRLLVLDNSEIVQEQLLAEILEAEPFEVTAQNFPDWSQKVQDWLFATYNLATIIFPPALYLWLLLSRAYLILIESGIILLFFRISKINIKYSKILQLVIALFVPAEIVNQAANLAGWQLPTSILSLSFWIFFVFVFFSIKKQSKL